MVYSQVLTPVSTYRTNQLKVLESVRVKEELRLGKVREEMCFKGRGLAMYETLAEATMY